MTLTAGTLSARAYDPTERYARRSVEGWPVYVHRDLLADAALAEKCLELLRVKLFDLQRVVPAAAVARLKRVPIWLELNDPKFPCACYHPSKEWLKANDVNPEKAGALEISNARRFLTWTIDQPWMILHELAHAYHHQVLGFDHPDVRAAYDAAKRAGTYDRVLRASGRTDVHYAMNNAQEYFAEATEAYFGTNDFYPFVRAELKQVDPGAEAMMRKLWGVTPATAPTSRPATVRAPK